MITFKQQFDKLTEAYIRGEVDAFDCKKCFVGNLLNGNGDWMDCRGDIGELTDEKGLKTIISIEANGFYTPLEIIQLEERFMDLAPLPSRQHEDLLFEAFSKTLDLLKQIHESKGEIVEPFEFVKRELTNDTELV